MREDRLSRITRQVLKEELSKNDVNSAINDKLSSSEFKKKMREIVADCMYDFFREMYTRDNLWKSAVKK